MAKMTTKTRRFLSNYGVLPPSDGALELEHIQGQISSISETIRLLQSSMTTEQYEAMGAVLTMWQDLSDAITTNKGSLPVGVDPFDERAAFTALVRETRAFSPNRVTIQGEEDADNRIEAIEHAIELARQRHGKRSGRMISRLRGWIRGFNTAKQRYTSFDFGSTSASRGGPSARQNRKKVERAARDRALRTKMKGK